MTGALLPLKTEVSQNINVSAQVVYISTLSSYIYRARNTSAVLGAVLVLASVHGVDAWLSVRLQAHLLNHISAPGRA